MSGIWPPDVGGPASHAPEVAAGLTAHGHTVEVVTTASAPPPVQSYRVRYVSRSLPAGARHAAVSALVARAARRADVVYATSMLGRTTVGTTFTRTPLVMKIAGDPAYERSLRRGWYSGTLADFQHAQLGPPVPPYAAGVPSLPRVLRSSSARARFSARSCFRGASSPNA